MAKPHARPNSTSLEELLKRKRPAKPQKEGEEWKVDELVAAPLAGIQEFVHMAVSPGPVAISLSTSYTEPGDRIDMSVTAMPETSMPVSSMPGPGMPDTNQPRSHPVPLPGQTTMPASSRKPMDRVIPIPHLVPAPEIIYQSGMPVSGMPDSSMPESSMALSDTPPASTDPNLLDFGAELELQPAVPTPVLHPIPPTKVQEIFTKGEAAVYATLWRIAGTVSKDLSRPYRDIRIGYIRLARESGMAWSNCRVNLNSLEAKLAISRVPPIAPGGPSGYRVYGFSMVYRRVTEAGYTHYIRSGRGVGLHKGRSGMLVTGMPDSTMPDMLSMPDNTMPDSIPGMPVTSMLETVSGMPDTGMHIESKRIPVVKPAPPPDLTEAVIALVTRYLGRCDATYADRMVSEILSVCPTATPDEIYAFVAANAPEIRQNPRIESKTGVLLSRAPASFTGEAFRKLRAALPLWKEQQALWVQRNDAYVCDWERDWKRRYFEELNAQAEREGST